MMEARNDQRVPLPGGRTLAFRDEGDRDAPAIVFNPGFMACRLTGRPAASGARIITADRPGIGYSDAAPGRTVLNWADDVARLADHLGLDRFAVLGHSAGSPYALACAARLGDRVRVLGIACGFAPLDRPGATEGVNKRMAKALPSMRRAPWMARLATSSLPRQYRRDPQKAFERQFGRDLPECDRAALADPDALALLLGAAVECTRQGARPLAVEMQLALARPWGFAVSEVSVGTRLWYGADDTLTPPQMGRYLASQIAGADLTVYPNEGHMALFSHWDEITGALAGG